MHGGAVFSSGDSQFSPRSIEDETGVYLGHQNVKGFCERFFSLSQECGEAQEAFDPARRRRERMELTYLMEKLVTEQEKSLKLEEQVKQLQARLEDAQSANRALSFGVLNDSCTTPLRVYDGMSAYDTGDTTYKKTETCLTQPLLFDESVKCSAAEIKIWENSSLSQLVFMRRRILSVLFGITNCIKRKHMTAIRALGVQEEIWRESDAEILATMHRMLSEAFYVTSIKDTMDLHFFAENISRTAPKTFDAALHDLKGLAEGEDIFNSYSRLQEFMSNTSLRFTIKWRMLYLNIMRNLLVAFAISLEGAALMNTRRAELEMLASQEVFHTALLRAARGCDVLSPSSFFMISDVNLRWRKDDSMPRLRVFTHTSSGGRVLTPPRGRRGVFGNGSTPQRSSPLVKRRWNSCRALPRRSVEREACGRAGSRGPSVASSTRLRDETTPATPTRRRTAETLGLHPMYRKSSLRTSSPLINRPSLTAAQGLRPFTPMRLRFASHQSYSADNLQHSDICSEVDGPSCVLKPPSRCFGGEVERRTRPRRASESPHLIMRTQKAK